MWKSYNITINDSISVAMDISTHSIKFDFNTLHFIFLNILDHLLKNENFPNSSLYNNRKHTNVLILPCHYTERVIYLFELTRPLVGKLTKK